jgi:hypothetical protein
MGGQYLIITVAVIIQIMVIWVVTSCSFFGRLTFQTSPVLVVPDWIPSPLLLPLVWVIAFIATCPYNKADFSSCTVQTWRWRQLIPPKCHYLHTRLYGVKVQKITMWTFVVVKTSDFYNNYVVDNSVLILKYLLYQIYCYTRAIRKATSVYFWWLM